MLTNGNRKDVVFLSCQQNTDNEDPKVKVELTWYGLPFAETDMWSPPYFVVKQTWMVTGLIYQLVSPKWAEM